MDWKNKIRSLMPERLKQRVRQFKKAKKNRELQSQKQRGEGWTKADLVRQLNQAGIEAGMDLLVHSSMSALGYVEGGPKTVVQALLEVVGPKGHVLMPSSPVVSLQAEHPTTLFDVGATPSKMGAITEVFRSTVAQARSAHPLEPVAVYGPQAQEYVQGHATDGTAYGPSSPWYKHMERGGWILYLGTTLSNSGTSLHAIEDHIGWANFSFPVYLNQSKTYPVRLVDGRTINSTTKVHNPKVSALRQCDGLIPLLESKGALRRVTVGKAPSLLVSAAAMKTVLLEAYYSQGITMYTPTGK